MSGGSLGSRASYGSSLSPPRSAIPRRPSIKMLVLSSKDKERILPVLWCNLVRMKVAMMIMAALALLVLIWGTFTRYHKDLLDRMPPPAVPRSQPPPPLRRDTSAVRNTGKNPSKRGRDRRSGSRQHRKAATGNRSKQVISKAMQQ